MTEHREPEGEGAVEHSTQSFFVAVGPDGVSRTVSMTETFSDGSTRHVDYEDVVVKDDPYVRLRQRIAGEAPPSEIFTEFLPSPVRPPTYPAGMPFLEGRASHSTESPRGSVSPSVRWRCTDPDVVMRALSDILVADGWTEAPLAATLSFLPNEPGQVFVRDGAMRWINRGDFAGGSVISLLELGDLSGLP